MLASLLYVSIIWFFRLFPSLSVSFEARILLSIAVVFIWSDALMTLPLSWLLHPSAFPIKCSYSWSYVIFTFVPSTLVALITVPLVSIQHTFPGRCVSGPQSVTPTREAWHFTFNDSSGCSWQWQFRSVWLVAIIQIKTRLFTQALCYDTLCIFVPLFTEKNLLLCLTSYILRFSLLVRLVTRIATSWSYKVCANPKWLNWG